ncbi:Delta(14)-sterol reductase [Psilocybe cubensis]|uniref:Delta(14)-sterol reductase n=2 Tax=Psilocybe cubensis TaxID=181762 RepID=A0ACB8H1D6_PSICU|nr:Delta(14)-sterol reductase [Psilocybe cubensis]KAH9481514.1 Delta(14)-sterol reductase [Psilocybe cubensis]
MSALNPRTTQYEFLGPLGALAISIGIPTVTYLLYFGCSEETGGCPPQLSSAAPIFQSISSLSWWKGLWDTEAALIYLAWYAFCVISWAILPGDRINGTTLRNGERKVYKINGLSTFLLALGITSGIIMRYGPESFTFIYHKWVGLLTASYAMSFAQATYFYIASFQEGKLLALGGNSGNIIYDWFKGRELNPSIGSFDIKSFNELRPGLILWVLINISMVCEQATRRGGFANVTDSMWLVLAFEAWYVADSLYNEPAVFTTMDIISDGFGFMLALATTYVPFAYSVQARYLVFHPIELGPSATIAIIFVNSLGYYIFRVTNGEKNDFRNGKNPKNLKFMTTKKGSKLITSGWWGRSRHPNYMGDLIMALAWSLPTGFNTPITYYYVIYFTILLIHRERRDDEACSQKYGEDWVAYKKLVPYRIIPYIY